jgi:hypothetical protein
MAENSQTAIEYIKERFPGMIISDSIVSDILRKTGIDGESPESALTEKERDLAYAYLILFLMPGMGSSQRVSDKDGDWQHEESVGSWSYSDRSNLLRIARALFEKWGVDDVLLDSVVRTWGFKGSGFHKIRRYHP